MVFEFPKSKYAYYILVVTTEVRHKCCCFQTSRMSLWIFVWWKENMTINKTQLVKKTQKI